MTFLVLDSCGSMFELPFPTYIINLDMTIDQVTLLPPDIIPMINFVWDKSFTTNLLNKKAIADCSWNELNYN